MLQAQVPAQDATAAQRMASANQAQAAEQARQQPQGEITVRKYQPVDLPGSVGDFVKSRGVRAPLLLLYGLAASAAQAMEPLLPVGQKPYSAMVLQLTHLDNCALHILLPCICEGLSTLQTLSYFKSSCWSDCGTCHQTCPVSELLIKLLSYIMGCL